MKLKEQMNKQRAYAIRMLKKAKDNNGSDKGKRQPHARASG